MKVEKNLKILAPKSCKSKHNPLSYEPMYWWCTCCTSHALVMWLQVMHQNIYSQNWIVKDVQDQKGLISAMRSNGPLPPSIIRSLWNLWLVTTTSRTRRKTLSLVFQVVDKEKPNQAFFPVICPGILSTRFSGIFSWCYQCLVPTRVFFPVL